MTSLSKLQQQDAFIGRHIGPNQDEIQTMLQHLEQDSLAKLIETIVPSSILKQDELNLSSAQNETTVLNRLSEIANKNKIFKSYIGMGFHDTITPPVILRNVLENPGWYTAYTPYQPEISQGRLEALLNFQQMIIDLTGMELANASLLDEATAAAEAMTLCKRSQKKNKSTTFFVADDTHPHTIAVVKTRAEHFGFEIVVGNLDKDLDSCDCFAALLQHPGTTGELKDLTPYISSLHEKNAMAVVACDLLALLLTTPPGEMGADVVIGNAQRFGVPLGFGGPHAAFLATRDSFKRAMPGRIIGVSIDTNGKQALRMAMQTREQHIRREKANSNICTAQALLAVMSSFYAVYHGPEGLKTIATRIHRSTALLAAGLIQKGFSLAHNTYIDTINVIVNEKQQEIYEQAQALGINLRKVSDDQLSISLNEKTAPTDIELLWQAFAGSNHSLDLNSIDQQISAENEYPGIPSDLVRTSAYLEHEVFNRYHSETDMLRYMKRLESKDIALNHSMIPLGSCTMKLNATTEMIPVTWSEFGDIHPFAPMEQAQGYQQLIEELEDMLVACTGYDAVSMQPNAGSQGEYAGLLAIKRYYEANDQAHRDVCLIPSSAHGTNPASAQMVSMKVVVVNCDNNGNIDLEDLRAKAEEHKDDLAALMMTYPSTHGVFEEQVTEICQLIHDHGGQVYVDGANMNALVGVAAPGQFGGDVSHLNLHKTFCIPHGGGGPGMGPIGVKNHLAPYLPNHPVQPIDGLSSDNDTVSATPWGSASILPISWAYIALMGKEGLRQATEVAILSANYIAKRLANHYPVLYTGRNGFVAHECIIDIRPIKEESGITEEDIAKRLMDYGFHAPTMSFPVAGTLMIEPTESESLRELDRFCDAMISIREEINKVVAGEYTLESNPLSSAPHTQLDVTIANWDRAYSRETAAFPAQDLKDYKYWPPVGRIDNVYGDRNLICTCPSIENYRDK